MSNLYESDIIAAIASFIAVADIFIKAPEATEASVEAALAAFESSYNAFLAQVENKYNDLKNQVFNELTPGWKEDVFNIYKNTSLTKQEKLQQLDTLFPQLIQLIIVNTFLDNIDPRRFEFKTDVTNLLLKLYSILVSGLSL